MTPGVDPDHGWLYAGDPLTPSTGYSANPGDYDADDQGTCVTGVVISPTYGVAKRANLVIVKTLIGYIDDASDAFVKIHNDILR